MIKTGKKCGYKSIKTPINDFLLAYAKSKSVRLHMPGHKGKGEKFCAYDVTEIDGADSLYFANGIIAESEKFAGDIYGANTFYSCEGSSLCIRAAVRLISSFARSKGENPLIFAARNAHSSFISALALCDVKVKWLVGNTSDGYLSCVLSAENIERELSKSETLPTAIYLTSPDYLGNITDVKAISEICHRRGVLLVVDNAHGAYLKFLTPSLHPIDLGADISVDSAHKTLPALTGAAYLHVSRSAPRFFAENAKSALALFGSTSPSYLILRSLDELNAILSCDYRKKIEKACATTREVKTRLKALGFDLCGDEPLKISILTKSYGYGGEEFAKILLQNKIVPDFYDSDGVVLMPSAQTTDKDFKKLLKILSEIPKKEPIIDLYPDFSLPKAAMSIKEAYNSARCEIDIDEALGKVAAENEIKCPPAVPIIIAGEIIDKSVISALKYYKWKKVKVIK